MVEISTDVWIALGIATVFILSFVPWSKIIGMVRRKPSSEPLVLRGADQPAPKGVDTYLLDLMAAAPEAPPDFILNHAVAKSTVATVQKKWIERLLSERKGGK